MRCLQPYVLRHDNPKLQEYILLSRIHYNDDRETMEVPCGRCIFCTQRKRSDWCFRLYWELRDHNTAIFLTMTYDEDHLPRSKHYIPEVRKKDVQDFHKRLRKHKKFRNFTVPEYGPQTQRPHYHGIYYGMSKSDGELIRDTWKNGNICVGKVEGASIAYVAKYQITREPERFRKIVRQKPNWSSISRRPAIGSNYLDQIRENSEAYQEGYVIYNEHKQPMPRYYRDKIYSEKMKKDMFVKGLERSDLQLETKINKLESLGYKDPWTQYDKEVQAMAYNLERKVMKGSTL